MSDEPKKTDDDQQTDADTVSNVEDHAGVLFPPPLMVVTVILTAWLVGKEWPLEGPQFEYTRTIGAALTAIGLVLIIVAATHFKRAKTNILPFKKTSKIIDTGVFARSRNPIYLSFIIIQIGVGLWLAEPWIILFLPITYLLLTHAVILKEEAYLKRTFGKDYEDYLKRVRRWF